MRLPLITRGRRRHIHRAGQLLVDAFLVALAWWLSFAFRFDGTLQGVYARLFAATIGVVIGVKLLVFIGARFYTKWWRFTSVRDLQAIVVAVTAASLIMTAVLSFWQPVHRKNGRPVTMPRGILVLDFFMTLTLVGGARFVVRSLIERPSRADLVAREGKEVIICGAGDAGNTMLREMQRNRALGYIPVGIIDDDERKAGLRVQGTRVLGPDRKSVV